MMPIWLIDAMRGGDRRFDDAFDRVIYYTVPVLERAVCVYMSSSCFFLNVPGRRLCDDDVLM